MRRLRAIALLACVACGSQPGRPSGSAVLPAGSGSAAGAGSVAGSSSTAAPRLPAEPQLTAPVAQFGSSAWRTGFAVWSIVYAGNRVVVGSKGVWVFDRATGKTLARLDVERPTARDAFDRTMDDLVTYANIPRIETSATNVLALGGERYAVLGGKKLQIVDRAAGKIEAETPVATEGLDPLAATRDRTRFAFRSGHDQAAMWTPATGARVELGTFDRVTDVAIAPDGSAVYVGDFRAVYRIATGTPRIERKFPNRHHLLDANERVVASASSYEVRFLDPSTLAVLATCKTPGRVWVIALAHDGRVGWATEDAVGICARDGTATTLAPRPISRMPTSIAWSPTADELAVGNDERLELYAVPGGADRAAAADHGGEIRVVTIDPTSARVATGASDGSVLVWDRARGKALRTVRKSDGRAIQALAWNGASLAIAERDGAVWLDDGAREVWRIRPGGRFPMGLAVSPDGASIAIDHGEETNRRGITIVDAKTGATIATIATTEKERSYQLYWRRGALWARTGEAVIAYDPARHAERSRWAVPVETTGLAIDAAETIAVTCVLSGECQVRQLADGAIVHRARIAKHQIRSIALSSDAKWAALGSAGGEVALWRLADDAPRAVRRHGTDWVVVAFAPDDASVVSGAADTTALVWKLN